MYKASQTFTIPSEAGAWNRIAIELITTSCYKPVEIKISVYDTSGFSESSQTISFTTPIAETTLIAPPAMDSVWLNLILKVQQPGSYCWHLETVNEDSMSKAIVHKVSPKFTSERAYNSNNSLYDTAVWVSKIYYASSKLERYLIREGAFDSAHQYISDAKSTNLWTIV